MRSHKSRTGVSSYCSRPRGSSSSSRSVADRRCLDGRRARRATAAVARSAGSMRSTQPVLGGRGEADARPRVSDVTAHVDPALLDGAGSPARLSRRNAWVACWAVAGVMFALLAMLATPAGAMPSPGAGLVWQSGCRRIGGGAGLSKAVAGAVGATRAPGRAETLVAAGTPHCLCSARLLPLEILPPTPVDSRVPRGECLRVSSMIWLKRASEKRRSCARWARALPASSSEGLLLQRSSGAVSRAGHTASANG